jgi:DNA-binding transcriptional MerR regulator
MATAEKSMNGGGSAPTIDQVRELLFGQEQRTLEARLEELRRELAATRTEFENKIAALRKESVVALEANDKAHCERFAKVGRALEEVGRAVGALSTS